MLRRRFVTGDVLLRRRFVMETFCYGDVLLGDVLSRRRFVRRRFVCASINYKEIFYRSIKQKLRRVKVLQSAVHKCFALVKRTVTFNFQICFEKKKMVHSKSFSSF